MKAFASSGGESTSEQLLEDLKGRGPELGDADLEIIPRRGVPRWHQTLERVFRDCVREGWIEKRRDKIWKLTEKGKQLAAGRRIAPKG